MTSTMTANVTADTAASFEPRAEDTAPEQAAVARELENLADATDAPLPKGRFARFLENTVAKRLGHRQLVRLALHRGQVKVALRELPQRMHQTAKQTQLMMELVDDFRSGAYRKIPWHSLAIGGAALLYAASPADVLPDALLGIGALDDIAVAAIAARVLRKDLKAYCEFKGYAVGEYFGLKSGR
jgi:uncharacterized membrane protein YkvA (DUF1232 family)